MARRMKKEYRTEHDLLGSMSVPVESLYGIHTVRAQDNFPLSLRPVPAELVCAYGMVKLACAMTNQELGVWVADPAKGEAIVR
ncbi:MAG TPA: hypothetical protein PLQ45_09970, partial [Anaerohalosphaeraceae bacterium]|nr:hypothetical protein [Anaerohalosphaeraceae bacterium]